jgi:3-deoxy-D-manno-octulosonic-acid transferase
MLPLYRFLTVLGAPAIHLYLRKRLAAGKEDAARFSERLGRASAPRPQGPLVWLHAASVGESLSMLPLIDRLLGDHSALSLLMTTGTVTSAQLMAERLPPRAFHQYVPVDRLGYVRRFLDHWKPDLALWAESEFWPNLVSETHRRGIPMVLVNGRISPRSFAGWQKARGLIAALLSDFALCLGQTEEDAARLRHLGAPGAVSLGNIKFAVPPLPVDAAEHASLTRALGERPRWLAASTHAGEEEIVAEAHTALAPDHPGLMSIIVPRHPERGAEITAMLRGRGFSVARRAAGEAVSATCDIYVADTLGELGLLYRLTEIAFLGKSLVPLGGQNPLEALRLGTAVLHGPHMGNFDKITSDMAAHGCAIEVADGPALARAVGALLADVPRRRAMAEAGLAYVEAEAGVVDRVAERIGRLLSDAAA